VDLYRYFVCTESDCTDNNIQCIETGCTEKTSTESVCTEIVLYRNTPCKIPLPCLKFKNQNMHWPQRTPKEHNKDRKGPQQDFKFGCHFALFGSNMYQILCQLGLRHRPHWGAYSTPPDPLGVFGPLWDVHFPFLPCDAAMLALSWES